MSASKRVRLHCDAPGCCACVDTSALTLRPARKRARQWGWRYRRLPTDGPPKDEAKFWAPGGNWIWADICPAHAEGDS